MKVFAQQGVAETKMSDVAQMAGIGKGTIYEYFRSREELHCSAFEDLMKKLNSAVIQKVEAATNPEEKIKAGFLAFFDFASMEIEDFVDILVDFWSYSVRNSGSASRFWFDMRRMYCESTSDILSKGIEDGLFRNVDVDKVASALIAAGDGLFLQWMADRKNFDLQGTALAVLDAFLNGIRKENN
ncbi:MAG: TetR family transcriptional regulator [Calditrichae bacterium]|nr:TetR family transcriptional regulator [Calditrichia bacterium]